MKTKKLYRYIGYNGTITSPVLLEGISHLVLYELRAEGGKILTNGSRTAYSVTVDEESVDNWKEIEAVNE